METKITERPYYSNSFVEAQDTDLGLKQIIEALKELHDEDEQDEYGLLRPSEYAFDTAMNLVVDASAQMINVPYGSVVADGEGGIRIEWKHRGCRVHLIVPHTPTREVQIYYSNGKTAKLEEGVFGSNLATRLEWLGHERFE